MTISDEFCQTEQERWVWKQLRAGNIPDFNQGTQYGGPLDSRAPQWPDTRVLRSAFLEAILRQPCYRDQLSERGVRIVGAWFREALDLSSTTLACHVWLEKCRFNDQLDLSLLRTSRSVSLENSFVGGAVSLGFAKIGGQLSMVGAKVTGPLNMNSLQVEGALFMQEGAEFTDVNLGGAKIGGQLTLRRSRISGPLDLRRLTVFTFHDSDFVWPEGIELGEFTYQQLPQEVADRKAKTLTAWLAKQAAYSPQPYEQLATVLQKAGYKGKANAVLYASKMREWTKTPLHQVPLLRKVWLLFLWAFIGFGFRTYFTLFWIAGLTARGVVILV